MFLKIQDNTSTPAPQNQSELNNPPIGRYTAGAQANHYPSSFISSAAERSQSAVAQQATSGQSCQQDLETSRATFLRFMAHELRTPLNNMAMIKSLQHSADLDPEARELIKHVVAGYNRLEHFCLAGEHFLEAQAHVAQSGNVCDMRQILADELQNLDPDIQAANIEVQAAIVQSSLNIDIPSEIAVFIVRTLLNNALKFGASAQVIELTLKQVGADLAFTVRDWGVGILPSNNLNIFEPFFVDDIEHHQQGSGVSIATARVYARLYGGELSAVSQGRQLGTTFELRLPVA